MIARAPECQKLTRAYQEMRYQNVTWHISYLCTYIPLNYDTPVLGNIFWVMTTCYISNGHRFTKSTWRILLLSTFHVSSINYSLICSLPIHTRSSANAEGPRAHCQLKSCKMLYRCTDCTWKGQQPVNDLQGHSRSLLLLPFDFLLVFHCKYILVLHRFQDINTYLPKN